MQASAEHTINTPEQLDALFGEVAEASRKKEISYIHPHYQALIEASPFAILATSGSENTKPNLPSAGTILAALTDQQIDGKKYDLELPERQRTTLY